MNIQFLLAVCDISALGLLAGLLIPFLLGYLVRQFIDRDQKTTIAALTAENNNMKKEIQAAHGWKSSLHHAEGETKKLKASLGALETDNTRLRAELDAAAKKMKPYEGIDLDSLHHRIADLAGINSRLQADLGAMTGLSSSLEDATASANMLREKFATLEADNIRLKASLKAATDAKNKIERSEENIGKLREDIRTLSGKLGAITVENERLKAGAAEAKALAGSNTGALESLTQKLAAAEAAAAAAAAQKAELEQLTRELADSRQQALAHKATADARAADLAALKTKLTDSEIDLSRAKIRAEELEAAAKNTSEADTMRARLTAYEGDIAALHNRLASTEGDRSQLQIQVQQLLAELDALKQAPPPLEAAATITIADDLTVVEGIGPKVNELLVAAGITTWRQLAGTAPDRIREILRGGGDRFAMLNPNSWPKQAALLADGKMDEFNAYTDYLVAGVDPAERTAAAAPQKVDDLEIVEGIGPKIEALLNAAGIYSFEQLAATPVEKIRQLLDDAGSRYQMHDPGTWPQQAQLAADGKLDELKTLQDQLKGGRE